MIGELTRLNQSALSECRDIIERVLKRFGENDIAAVKVSDVRKLSKLLNPEPDTFRIPTERTDAAPYEAMSQNRIDRLLFGEQA